MSSIRADPSGEDRQGRYPSGCPALMLSPAGNQPREGSITEGLENHFARCHAVSVTATELFKICAVCPPATSDFRRPTREQRAAPLGA